MFESAGVACRPLSDVDPAAHEWAVSFSASAHPEKPAGA